LGNVFYINTVEFLKAVLLSFSCSELLQQRIFAVHFHWTWFTSGASAFLSTKASKQFWNCRLLSGFYWSGTFLFKLLGNVFYIYTVDFLKAVLVAFGCSEILQTSLFAVYFHWTWFTCGASAFLSSKASKHFFNCRLLSGFYWSGNFSLSFYKMFFI